MYSALLFSLVSKGFGRAEELLSPAALVAVQKVRRTIRIPQAPRDTGTSETLLSRLPLLFIIILIYDTASIRQRLFLPLHRLGVKMLHVPSIHQIDPSTRPKEVGVWTSDSRDHLAGVVHLPHCSAMQPVSAVDIHGPALR